MSICLERKALCRTGWARVLSSTFTWREVDFPALRGVAGLHQLHRVRAPLVSAAFPEKIIAADDGFSWLQLAPEGAHWWLSAMFNPAGEIVQYYLDITRQNCLCGADSWFDDLFLDVVALPDGRAVLLDEDELTAALNAEQITPAEANLAQETARQLLTALPHQIDRLSDCCRQLRFALLADPAKKIAAAP